MKNRARIIGLAVAGVAGTSGAAFAGMQVHDEPTAQPTIATGSNSTVAPETTVVDGTVTYQVGAAGTVAVTRTAGSLSVSAATAGAGWSVLAVSGPGGHVEVQFTDSFQVVTFAADAVGDDISVALTNVAAPGVETTTVPGAPIDVQIVSNTPAPGTTQTPWPQPATPPATPAPTTPHSTNAPGTTQPTPATTAAPSSGGEDDDDDHEDDDHEDEGDDHEDEDEGDDD